MIRENNKKQEDRMSIFQDNIIKIGQDEFSRLWGGELTEFDFSTSSPNSYRIEKIARGIDEYLKYKRNHIEDFI